MRSGFILSALFLGLLLGCSSPLAERPRECFCAEQGDSPMAQDDLRLKQRLESEGAKLIEAGRTVNIATLVKQLNSSRCRLALASPHTENLAGEELYRRARPSVVVIAALYKCEKCAHWHAAPATGFVISRSGACVTNYHVVNEPMRETLIAATSDGRIVPVKSVLAASRADDIAIVQLDVSDLTPLALASPAPVGSHIWVISHPDMRFYSLTEGIISRYFALRRENAAATMMAITADYARGSSGGPVLNDHGDVVGLVSSTTSIYYGEKNGQKENLQMVIKQCVPVASVRPMVEGD